MSMYSTFMCECQRVLHVHVVVCNAVSVSRRVEEAIAATVRMVYMYMRLDFGVWVVRHTAALAVGTSPGGPLLRPAHP